MNGTTAAAFSPNATMTRAQLCAVLYRMAGSPEMTGRDTFTDTPDGAWYEDAVLWAVRDHIMSGYTDRTFGPDDPITREQLAAILMRYDQARTEELSPEPAPEEDTDVLVAYFSATGNTENIAEQLAGILDADLYEIVPQVPYTSEDLNYSNSDCRANQEQNDPTARPAISGSVENMEDYEVIFLGYPIWWGDAPKILSTFLETYDFGGKTIAPFCTSGSSSIGSSADDLEALTQGAAWLEGRRFSGSDSRETVSQWVGSLGLALRQVA